MQLLALLAALGASALALELGDGLRNSTNGTNGTNPEEAALAREAKLAAVNKVAVMLEDLRAQVLEEGEKEAQLYNKFSCFCKDTMTDKGDAITSGEGSLTTLRADIGSLATDRDTLDTDIAGLVTDIEGFEGDLVDLHNTSKHRVKKYQSEEADLRGAVEALQGAIQSLKAAKNPSLIQYKQVAGSVRDALELADALGLGGESLQTPGMAFLLQDGAAPAGPPAVETEAYTFRSDGVISTLEGLLKTFKDKKNTVDEAEVTARATAESTEQTINNDILTKNREMATKKKEKSKKQAEIAEKSEDMSVVSSTLLADQAYMNTLAKMCSDKGKTWDSRSQVRTDELSALTEAISIVREQVATNTSGATLRFAQRAVRVRLAEVHDVADVQLVEASAEAAAESEEAASQQQPPASFLQQVARHSNLRGTSDPRKSIVDLLRSEGKHLQSTMLTSLASQIAEAGTSSGEDPFAKVKQLLEELIERLLKQATAEANQKGWCDKSMTAASQKRDFAVEEITGLNGNMAQLEALREKLGEEITLLDTEIQDLNTEQNETDAERAQEKIEHTAIVVEANAGKDAVQAAITLLDRFYKTAANTEVNLTLLQKGPADDAPSTGFDSGEAYAGASDAAEGVIGLLEVIRSDFQRTVTETEAAEREAVQDHIDFTTKTQSSIATKTVAKNEKTTQKNDADGEYTTAEGDLTTQTDLLKGAVGELMQLHAACVDTAMSWEDRLARRDEEIAALKKAECVLNSYAQYGPDAAVSASC